MEEKICVVRPESREKAWCRAWYNVEQYLTRVEQFPAFLDKHWRFFRIQRRMTA